MDEVEDAAEGDWSESEDDSSEEEGSYSQHKPIYAFWAEKGLIKPQNMRSSGKGQRPGLPLGQQGGRKRRLQAGCSSIQQKCLHWQLHTATLASCLAKYRACTASL